MAGPPCPRRGFPVDAGGRGRVGELFIAAAASVGMNLTLKFFATFREAVGSKIIEREYDDGNTVGDVLSSLESEFEGLSGRLLEDGELAPQINVLLNGREVLHMEGPATELDDGDTLSVFPPVAGG